VPSITKKPRLTIVMGRCINRRMRVLQAGAAPDAVLRIADFSSDRGANLGLGGPRIEPNRMERHETALARRR
jgi:hypothetical protein